ncbi:MAG TPA: ATP-binding cassette domain-containing protein [Firmicutes bacterium]|nr:ATP-binding cassette domain-containing protein [Candidatus Fermentithermobacillaceae bacterium]
MSRFPQGAPSTGGSAGRRPAEGSAAASRFPVGHPPGSPGAPAGSGGQPGPNGRPAPGSQPGPGAASETRRPPRGPGSGPAFARPVEKAKDFRGTLKRLIAYMGPQKWTILIATTFAVLSTLMNAFTPRVMGRATTAVYNGVMRKLAGEPGPWIDFQAVGRILAMLAALYVVSSVFVFVQQITMARVAQRTVYDMRKRVQAKLARLPLKYFDSRPHGEILSRITNDIDTVSGTLQESLSRAMSSLISFVSVLAMMVSISPVMTLITLATMPLSVVITRQVTMRSQRYFAGQQRALGQLNGHVEEMYTGHRIIKAFGREKASIERFKEINEELTSFGWRAQFVSGIMMPLMALVNNMGYVGVCVVGALFVARKTLEIGDVQAFMTYSRQLTQPIVQVASIANIIQSTVAAAERVFEILDEEEEQPDPEDAAFVEEPQGEVKMEHVRFGYSPDAILMHDLSIDVKPGQTIAIVGPTGAGKTTLVNLLMRFYDVQGGRITIDGVDIRDMKRGHLRSLFGMVLQDAWLFSGTIRENIAYGKPGATEQEIVRAAKMALADRFIRTLPDGYDTVLKEDASNLSQGQMQLLTIARAVLADPAILILDEATSSVDTRTEVQIQRAMKNLMRGRTSFVIAHRLSTIRDADLILVMDNGTIVEQGTHRDLLAKKGFYAELYYSQFVGSNAAAG